MRVSGRKLSNQKESDQVGVRLPGSEGKKVGVKKARNHCFNNFNLPAVN